MEEAARGLISRAQRHMLLAGISLGVSHSWRVRPGSYGNRGNIPTAGLSPAPGHLLLHFQNSKTLKVTCIHLPGFGTSYPLYFKHLILTFFAIVILMISLSQNLLFCSFQCTEM